MALFSYQRLLLVAGLSVVVVGAQDTVETGATLVYGSTECKGGLITPYGTPTSPEGTTLQECYNQVKTTGKANSCSDYMVYYTPKQQCYCMNSATSNFDCNDQYRNGKDFDVYKIFDDTATSYGDPHIKTWGSGGQYDFHGGCDLVLLQNENFADGLGMEIQIRTTIHTWWSSISSAAIRLGDYTLQITGGNGNTIKCWINGEEQELESGTGFMGDFSVAFRRINDNQSQTRLDLGNSGDAISIETYKHFVRVNLKDKKKTSFVGSLGLLGAYPLGQKIGRDGMTEFTDNNEFGQEWMVRPSDMNIFHDADSHSATDVPLKCPMPEDKEKFLSSQRRLGELSITEEDATVACAHVTNKSELDACINDVLATNDKDIAGSY